MASHVKNPPIRGSCPLQGLQVFVMHVKQPLTREAHLSEMRDTPSVGIKTRIKNELQDLEKEAQKLGNGTGVEFVMTYRGMRIVI